MDVTTYRVSLSDGSSQDIESEWMLVDQQGNLLFGNGTQRDELLRIYAVGAWDSAEVQKTETKRGIYDA